MKLHEELLKLRSQEKQIAHEIIEKLQMMEHGRQYLPLGYSSLFDYLVRGLGYSESAAYRRQACVRLANEIPEVKDKIQTGVLTTAGLGMAFKSLKGKSTEQKMALIKKIENKPSREVKNILSDEQMAPEIKVQKTKYQDKVILRLELSHRQNQKLERLKALKAHGGSLEELLEKLLDRELKAYEKVNHKRTKSLNPRFVSGTLRNDLLKRARYKCQFPGCEETHFLQIDHIRPVRNGGLAQEMNLQVLCGAHNRLKG